MLSQLRNIVEQVSRALSIEAALDLLVRQIRQTMDVDCCSVYLAETHLSCYRLCATDGLALSAVGKVTMPFGEGLVGFVGQREEPINLADAPSHPNFKYLPETAEESFSAFLGTPITYKTQVLGVLVVQQHDARSFDDSEESFLVTLAAQLAGVLASSDQREKFSFAQAQSWQEPFKAISASNGIALAKAWLNRPAVSFKQVRIRKVDDISAEIAAFDAALERTRNDLSTLGLRLNEQLPQDVAAIFDVYQHMLADASLGGDIRKRLHENYSASSAVKLVVEHYVAQFEAMSDQYFRERAIDVKDLGLRLLENLQAQSSIRCLPSAPIILVAKEVTASMFAELPHELIAGVVSQRGAASSHAAILARAMGIPALLGFDLDVSKLDERELIVDGYTGELFVEPDALLLGEYKELLKQQSELDSLVNQEIAQNAISLDGVRVELLLNAGLNREGDNAVRQGADGIGLYRTEVPFLLRDRFPTEQEQYKEYREVLASYGNKLVCMRTLDVGGDKQLPYFPIIEDNPFLGWRGIRLTLDHPDIFLAQARAMYRAALEFGNLSVLLPMISTLREVDEALRLLDKAWREVVEENNGHAALRPLTGVMLEVPSALYILPELAKRVDFWSVGSNDLTQYMLAVDRNNPRVAGLFDCFNPAIVRALYEIVLVANESNTPVCLCGELAGDPLGALLLLALGYRSLSMSSYCLGKIKYLLRHIRLDELATLRADLLESESGKRSYHLLYAFLEERQLTHLVRVAGLES